MKPWFALLFILVGCQSWPKHDFPSVIVLESDYEKSLITVREFNMPKDSGLYRTPTAPKEFSPQESEEYIQGYRCGWTDRGEDIQWKLDGNGKLSWFFVPASAYIVKKSDIFKRGYADGAKCASKDLKIFEKQIRKEIKAQNKKIDCTKKGSIFAKESITLRQKKNSK